MCPDRIEQSNSAAACTPLHVSQPATTIEREKSPCTPRTLSSAANVVPKRSPIVCDASQCPEPTRSRSGASSCELLTRQIDSNSENSVLICGAHLAQSQGHRGGVGQQTDSLPGWWRAPPHQCRPGCAAAPRTPRSPWSAPPRNAPQSGAAPPRSAAAGPALGVAASAPSCRAAEPAPSSAVAAAQPRALGAAAAGTRAAPAVLHRAAALPPMHRHQRETGNRPRSRRCHWPPPRPAPHFDAHALSQQPHCRRHRPHHQRRRWPA